MKDICLNWKQYTGFGTIDDEIEIQNLFELYLLLNFLENSLDFGIGTDEQIVDGLFNLSILKRYRNSTLRFDCFCEYLHSFWREIEINQWKTKFHSFEQLLTASNYCRLCFWASSWGRRLFWENIVLGVNSRRRDRFWIVFFFELSYLLQN